MQEREFQLQQLQWEIRQREKAKPRDSEPAGKQQQKFWKSMSKVGLSWSRCFCSSSGCGRSITSGVRSGETLVANRETCRRSHLYGSLLLLPPIVLASLFFQQRINEWIWSVERKEPARHPLGLYHVPVLNWTLTSRLSAWKSPSQPLSGRVPAGFSPQNGYKDGRKRKEIQLQVSMCWGTGRGLNTKTQHKTTLDIEQEPTLFYKSSNMVSLGFSVLGSRSPWDMGPFSHKENRIPVFLQVRNQLSCFAYQMYKYF